MACRASDTLRFPVGATIEANVGGFVKGIVLKHWDEGNATVSNSKTDARPMSGHPSTWTGTFVLPNKKKKHKRKEKTKRKIPVLEQWYIYNNGIHKTIVVVGER